MTETTTTERTWRQLTQPEFAAAAIARFGENPLDWAYVCPGCGDVATARDFPPGKRGRAGLDCIGRHLGALDLEAARGCNQVAWGLNPGPWTVELPGGELARCFALADAPSRAPMTARLMGPADAARGVVGKCRACGTSVSVHGNDGLAASYVTDQGLMCGQHCDAEPKRSRPPQSAPPDSSGTPGGAAVENAPAAPYATARGLSVERRTPRERPTHSGGAEIFDMENWDYRVALTDHQSVLGYHADDLRILFADVDGAPLDCFHDVAHATARALEHIAYAELPITALALDEAVRLIRDAAHLDEPTRPELWNADAAKIPAPSAEFLGAAPTPRARYWTAADGWADGIDCSCHVAAPCSPCESLRDCERCGAQVPEHDMQAHVDSVHPDASPPVAERGATPSSEFLAAHVDPVRPFVHDA